jgi:hypothetical protein
LDIVLLTKSEREKWLKRFIKLTPAPVSCPFDDTGMLRHEAGDNQIIPGNR